jgi:hypothetical protein
MNANYETTTEAQTTENDTQQQPQPSDDRVARLADSMARQQPEQSTEGSGPLDAVRRHEAAIQAHLATRQDRLGHAVRYVLALARDEQPAHEDRRAVQQGTDTGQAFGNVLGGPGPIQRALGPHVEELEREAAEAEDPEVADACAVLAALARGEDPPEDAAQRTLERVRDGQK